MLSDEEANQVVTALKAAKAEVNAALLADDMSALKLALKRLKGLETDVQRYNAYLQAKVRENILSSMKVHAVRLQANDIDHSEFVNIIQPKLDLLIDVVADVSALSAGEVF